MHNGKPLAFLHSIKDEGNVKTRLNQLRAYESPKSLEIAKAILTQKIENENNLLKHLNLKPYEQNSARVHFNLTVWHCFYYSKFNPEATIIPIDLSLLQG